VNRVIALRAVRRARALAWISGSAVLLLPRWVMLLIAGGWALMLSHAIRHGAHAHHANLTASEELAGWMAMVVAMMLPTTASGLHELSLRSYRDRRTRAHVLYVCTMLGVWLVAGLPLVALRSWPASHDLRVAAVAFAMAALWALTPWRQALVQACHRTLPLAPSGLAADRSAVVQALVATMPCVAACGALMAGCLLTGHRLVPMLVGAAATWAEKVQFRPDARPQVAAATFLAVWCLLAAV
jgi:hypothetical protein